MRIPDLCLRRLKEAGLLVSEPFSARHRAFPDGVFVGKPTSAGGNCVPGFKESWGSGGPTLDAPAVFLHEKQGKWFVTSHDYVPGPGPGDFLDEWPTAEDAIADILDFYFGDARRMALKR